jgi:hypothetical protein
MYCTTEISELKVLKQLHIFYKIKGKRSNAAKSGRKFLFLFKSFYNELTDEAYGIINSKHR